MVCRAYQVPVDRGGDNVANDWPGIGLGGLASVVLAAPALADSNPDPEKMYVVDCDGDGEVLNMLRRQLDS